MFYVEAADVPGEGAELHFFCFLSQRLSALRLCEVGSGRLIALLLTYVEGARRRRHERQFFDAEELRRRLVFVCRLLGLLVS